MDIQSLHLKREAIRANGPSQTELAKCPTGIRGLDLITGGGLPRGRPTLICGGAGSGKTLFGMEFLVRGADGPSEGGVFISFEERPDDLIENVSSLGFNLKQLMEHKLLAIDQIKVERSQVLETGDYNLDGLFSRIGAAIDSVRAKRVVLDSIEVLFGAFNNTSILRTELQRLFEWLKDREVTAIVTSERGAGSLTRNGIEEYVSDCVILLDQRVIDQVTTRRLRVVKYRGSLHGLNEYPFLISSKGLEILPITSIALDYPASNDFISSGITELDNMLGGKGYYRGSTLLVSGIAGTGKTCVAAHFVEAACRRGERCVYFAFEESPLQLSRNMLSIGIDLQKWVKQDLLRFDSVRPATLGLELHISTMLKQVDEFQPQIVVLDPVSSFGAGSILTDVNGMLMRLIDLFKSRQITVLFTSLTKGGTTPEQSTVGVSSMIDSWVLLRNVEYGGRRTRGLYILKSRGQKHSHQVREMFMTGKGIQIKDLQTGSVKDQAQ